MAYDRRITFVWNAGQEARVFNVQLLVKYVETNTTNGQTEEKELPWVLASDLERTDDAARVSLFIEGEDFYLVAKGMAFRDAHSCVGRMVSFALSENKELHELTLKELKSFSGLVTKDVFKILKTEQMINRRASFGGTAAERVSAAIDTAEKSLKKESAAKRRPR